jgi:hypothetical protein
MSANNFVGALLPPFLRLPHHSTTMHELDELIIAIKAWMCPTPNAYQMRKSL